MNYLSVDEARIKLMLKNPIIVTIALIEFCSGFLRQAIQVLAGVSGIRICRFSEADVVRHPLVQDVIRAYDAWEQRRHKPRDKSDSAPPADANQDAPPADDKTVEAES